MNATFKKELDPVFEITSLLFFCRDSHWAEDMIEALNKYGLDGIAFYQKHCKIVEKYIKTFQKHHTAAPDEDFFFTNISDDLMLLTLVIATEARQYSGSWETVDESALRSFIAYCVIDHNDRAVLPDVKEMPDLPDEKSMIDFLDGAELQPVDKWYLLKILRRPAGWLEGLFKIINRNLPAYEKARQAVEKPLGKLLDQLETHKDQKYLKILEAYGENTVIYATLAAPFLISVMYRYGYQGVLSGYVTAQDNASGAPKELLIRQLKALSEKSKLDILSALKSKSRYNLELAEVLGISPSTASHHMNDLLSCGFVTVEKRGGKVYYCVAQDTLHDFMRNLQLLLFHNE